MKSRFNLQFFGGGTDVTRCARRDPEPEELTNLRKGLYSKITPGLEAFDTDSWTAQNTTNQALQQQSSLLGQIPNALTQNNNLAEFCTAHRRAELLGRRVHQLE